MMALILVSLVVVFLAIILKAADRQYAVSPIRVFKDDDVI